MNTSSEGVSRVESGNREWKQTVSMMKEAAGVRSLIHRLQQPHHQKQRVDRFHVARECLDCHSSSDRSPQQQGELHPHGRECSPHFHPIKSPGGTPPPRPTGAWFCNVIGTYHPTDRRLPAGGLQLQPSFPSSGMRTCGLAP